MATTRREVPREEFTSSKGASYINLGNFKNKLSNSETYKPQMMVYTDTMERTQNPSFEKGINTTKFGKGFQRRREVDCTNPRKDEITLDKIKNNEKARATAAVRSHNIQAIDQMNGYDIITHTHRGNGPKDLSKGMKKVDNSMVREAVEKRSKKALQDAAGRYFLPLGSGPSHDFRQNVLYMEGLNKGKFTAEIQLGKPVHHSYGLEDQFSKSQYMQTNEVTQKGLYEARIPGKYTPRQVQGNPSGNTDMVRKWATTVDLKNSAANLIHGGC
jgi:hypothetical protein